MKIFISVDMEGISGIVDGSMVSSKQGDYAKGRKLMAEDVNAAIEGILSVNPKAEITICDAHGAMNNILPEDIKHKDAILVRGRPKPQSQMAGIDSSFDAAVFIGYHAKKGTQNGMMSHTYSGGNIESLHINGVEVGETAMNAGIAGYYGVPLVFVAGDIAVTKEAKEVNHDIETVAVKEAISRVAAKCIHPAKAREMIKQGVAKAIKKKVKPLIVGPPVIFDIRFTDAKKADAASFIPSAERVDGKTIRITHDDYVKAYHGFLAAIACATAFS
ncbi:MAG: M55 family metallopeptidase [Candidatus Bathyarchaeota archaeon]|nr:M55 family metallopeptidase [Candidatus Bathyarchaeota archaeon]